MVVFVRIGIGSIDVCWPVVRVTKPAKVPILNQWNIFQRCYQNQHVCEPCWQAGHKERLFQKCKQHKQSHGVLVLVRLRTEAIELIFSIHTSLLWLIRALWGDTSSSVSSLGPIGPIFQNWCSFQLCPILTLSCDCAKSWSAKNNICIMARGWAITSVDPSGKSSGPVLGGSEDAWRFQDDGGWPLEDIKFVWLHLFPLNIKLWRVGHGNCLDHKRKQRTGSN